MVEKVLVDNNKVDVNKAEEQELTHIPGIGPVLAQRIIQKRPYKTVEDMTRVPGIKDAMLERMKPYMALVFMSEEDMSSSIESTAPVEEVMEDTPPLLEEPVAEESVPVKESSLPLPMPETPPPLPIAAVEAVEPVVAEVKHGVSEEAPPVTPLLPTPLAEPVVEEAPQESVVELKPEKMEKEVEETEVKGEVLEPAPPRGPKVVTRGQFVWWGLLILVLAMAFGVALSLGILSGMNGGLRYVAPEQVAALSRDLTALSSQAGAMQTTLDSMQKRLDNLEALSGRIDALESVTGGLQKDVSSLSADVDALDSSLKVLDEKTTALRTELDVVTEQASRFQNVMDGLRDLLNNLFPVK